MTKAGLKNIKAPYYITANDTIFCIFLQVETEDIAVETIAAINRHNS